MFPIRWHNREVEESLDRYLEKLRRDVEEKPYEYWAGVEETITFEDVFEGQETQAEYYIFEKTPDYVLVDIQASNSPTGWYYHRGFTVTVENKSASST